jgi:predicted adenylyl cyclase CyaB
MKVKMSQTEIEVKILDIDVPAIRQQLQQLGAHTEFDQREFWAVFFDDPQGRIVAKGDLLRVRKEGEEVVMTYKKKIVSHTVKVMEELETTVGDMDTVCNILRQLGLQVIQETRKLRSQFALRQGHVVIDEYQDYMSIIPPFVEIETDSREKLHEIVTNLGFGPEDCKNWNTHDLMRHYEVESSKGK